uniref:Uncharacterized protein n=1 Tax=Molossus molossus TaxID=27622 RepID=A0A7J8J7P0_MOLMO|nr:hypothetical protein HJG59_009580 [Molossus molossus]
MSFLQAAHSTHSTLPENLAQAQQIDYSIMPLPRRCTYPLSKASTFRLLNLVYPPGVLSFASLRSQLCWICRRGACCICQGVGQYSPSAFIVSQTRRDVPPFPCFLHHIRKEHWPNSVMNCAVIYFWFYNCLDTLQSSIYNQPLRDFSRLMRFSYFYPIRPNISQGQAIVYWRQGAFFSQLIALLCSSWESRMLLLKYLEISDHHCREHLCCLCHQPYWDESGFPPNFFTRNGIPCLLKHFLCPELSPVGVGISQRGFYIDSENLVNWIRFFKYLYYRQVIKYREPLMLQELAGIQLLRMLSRFAAGEPRFWRLGRLARK